MGASEDFGAFLVEGGFLSVGAWDRVQDVLAEAQQGLAGTITGLGLLSEVDLSLDIRGQCTIITCLQRLQTRGGDPLHHQGA